MKDIEDSEYQSAFASIKSAVKHKTTEFYPVFSFRINDAKNVLREVVRGLESIANPNKEGYHPIKHFDKIRSVFLSEKGEVSEQNIIDNMSSQFKDYLSLLDRLLKNPEEIYENKNASELLVDMCDKMTEIYSEETLSEES